MKVLVTGTAGQLGSYVAELLLGRHEVSGLDIRQCPYRGVKGISRKGDIRDVMDVRKAVRGADAVVHCAAQVSVEKSTEDPLTDAETNVLGTIILLDESAKAGVGKFVYVASAAVYGNPRYQPIDEHHPTHPMSNYGASKLAGEKFALAFAQTTDMDAVSVRPFNFYSPRADPKSPYSGVITKFVSRVRTGKSPIIEGDGKQTRDFIHALDVADMIKLVLTKKGVSGEAINCGCGSSTSILSLAKTTISVSGRKLKPEFTRARVGDIRHSLADTTKARELLGFKPKIELEDGLAELLR
jgi:UDP-glucose 4-epimerase